MVDEDKTKMRDPQELRLPVRVRIEYIWTLAGWISVYLAYHAPFEFGLCKCKVEI